MSFLAELKRRKVYQVAVLYVVCSWMIMQVVDVMFPALRFPDWTITAAAVLVIVGFPISLTAAWLFELTPEGIKLETDDAEEAPVDSPRGRGIQYIAIGMLSAAAILLVLSNDWIRNESSPHRLTGEAKDSIAVLAFANLSPNPENAYFAEGVSEEILNLLAGVDGLSVISRTSAFSYADKDLPIPVIAEQLGVHYILDGSVRRQGNVVRITAQLIDAQSDEFLWSDTFDRGLEDIFAMQEEIAKTVASNLESVLALQIEGTTAPTDDLEAFELFLRGRTLFYERGDELEKALEDLRFAVEKDPDFAQAWALLAATASVSLGYLPYSEEEENNTIGEARAAALRALSLNSESGLAMAVLGRRSEGRLEGLNLMKQATEVSPNDSTVLLWAGDRLFTSGAYLDESLPLLERAYRLDPLVGVNNGILGIAYLANGQRDLGRYHIQRGQALGWDPGVIAMILDAHAAGDVELAKSLSRELLDPDPQAWTRSQNQWWRLVSAMHSSSIDVLEFRDQMLALRREGNPMPKTYAEGFIGLLILDGADLFFDQWELANRDAFRTHPEIVNRWLFIPGSKPFVEHPRYLEMGAQIGLLDLWKTRGYPMGCLRVQDDAGDHLSCSNWPE